MVREVAAVVGSTDLVAKDRQMKGKVSEMWTSGMRLNLVNVQV